MLRDRSGDDAESIAIKGLSFLAGDPERLGRFLAMTGLGPENLREAAASPGFLGSVLAHLAEDESLLLAFAAEAGLRPEHVARAAERLRGPRHDEFDA
jgi:Protein of unknown function (DUF3572)